MENFPRNILVVGDIMLDIYWMCDSVRENPEANAPLLTVRNINYSAGGASNLAVALKDLGSDVSLLGNISNDCYGAIIETKLKEKGIDTSLLLKECEVCTQKIRAFNGDSYHVRLDKEASQECSWESFSEKFTEYLLRENKANNIQICVLSDYNKGFLTEDVCQDVIWSLKEFRTYTIVDPKSDNINKYSGCWLITPNVKELEKLTNINIKNEEDELRTCNILLESGIQNVLVTKAEKGMTLYANDKSIHHFISYNKTPKTVIGAGDIVVASIAHYINNNSPSDLLDAIEFASRSVAKALNNIGTARI